MIIYSQTSFSYWAGIWMNACMHDANVKWCIRKNKKWNELTSVQYNPICMNFWKIMHPVLLWIFFQRKSLGVMTLIRWWNLSNRACQCLSNITYSKIWFTKWVKNGKKCPFMCSSFALPLQMVWFYLKTSLLGSLNSKLRF